MITHLQSKIDALVNNSEQKLKTAANIAADGDFASATSFLVTAFEEKTKAVVLQLYDIGFPIVSDDSHLDYIFRQHDARHYIGFYADCMYEVLGDVIELFKRFRVDKDFMFKVLKFNLDAEMEANFSAWALIKIDSFLKKIDFYQNIEKTRQAGLYIDVLDHGALNKVINATDYNFIESRLNTIHLISEDLKFMKSSKEQNLQNTIQDSIEEMENKNMAEHFSNAIFLVKDKRNKVFNDLRDKLIAFKSQL